MPQPTPPTSHRPLSPPALPLVPDFGRPPDQERPLPDAAAVRRLAVPDPAPPYDDERQGAGPDRAGTSGGVPAVAGEPDHREPDHREPDRGEPDGARGWPGKFAQVLAETLAGSRPPRQIVPWTTEEARRHIRRLGPMLAAGQRPLVRRVVASCPAADVVEMTAVVRFGPRVRALAIRLERDGPRCAGPGHDATQERWRCTAVEAA